MGLQWSRWTAVSCASRIGSEDFAGASPQNLTNGRGSLSTTQPENRRIGERQCRSCGDDLASVAPESPTAAAKPVEPEEFSSRNMRIMARPLGAGSDSQAEPASSCRGAGDGAMPDGESRAGRSLLQNHVSFTSTRREVALQSAAASYSCAGRPRAHQPRLVAAWPVPRFARRTGRAEPARSAVRSGRRASPCADLHDHPPPSTRVSKPVGYAPSFKFARVPGPARNATRVRISRGLGCAERRLTRISRRRPNDPRDHVDVGGLWVGPGAAACRRCCRCRGRRGGARGRVSSASKFIAASPLPPCARPGGGHPV